MEKKRGMLHRIKAGIDLPEELTSTRTIVEVLGRKQARIVQHRGIAEYRDTCIRVMTKKGSISITGSKLEIVVMNRERIVISGRIDCLDFSEGDAE